MLFLILILLSCIGAIAGISVFYGLYVGNNELRFFRLREAAYPPMYGTDGASGADLRTPYDVTIPPGARGFRVPLGIAVEVPEGYEMQIRSRSGIASKTPLRISNAPGTIDSDYRGEIVVLFDHTDLSGEPIKFSQGDRVAQAVLAPYHKVRFTEVVSLADLSTTKRGSGGFGHTGR